ncbi:hypothetical protein [Cellulomonas endometrii]|uniref:hypothetical protein n=1 Tax=Cellulomonas endometrii TaxID=3036301 RepID=UPI0024AD65B2|nr:hypothetical protein [Cellulomonas endometrii]
MTADLPVILDVDPLVSWFESRGEHLTIAEIEAAGALVGRNSFPALVINLHLSCLLPDEVFAHGLVSAWQMAEFPTIAMPPDEWSWLFDDVGFTRDGIKTTRPTEPVTLYRGAVPEHARGWSWTEDVDLARWFANRFPGTGARLYRTTVRPPWLMAHITPEWKFGRHGESEWVVDPSGPHVIEEVR